MKRHFSVLHQNSNHESGKGGREEPGAEPGFEYRGAIDKTNWTTDKEK
jgi:hypothetical protein